jgi:serine/threonine-protein kinase RsbT
MPARVLSQQQLRIDREDDIVTVRRKVRAIAQERGFDSFASAALTTAASELARNVWTHARSGEVLVEEIMNDANRVGVRMTFSDRGPGIRDLARVLAGGYSTVRSLGLGLSGSKRLVDEFALESVVGQGTTVTVVKWARF